MRLYIHAHKDPRLPLNKLTCIYFLREGAFHILDEAMKILQTQNHTPLGRYLGRSAPKMLVLLNYI